jgi:transcriptional regulator with XRE-family HTH domain
VFIGARVRKWRRAKHLSRAELAERLGATTAEIREYELSRIGSERLFRIGDALGAPVPLFFANNHTEIEVSEPFVAHRIRVGGK